MPSSAPPPGGRRAFFIAGRDAAAARSLAGRMGGGTADLLFPLIFPPTLISVTPDSGLPAGGTVVDLAGMNFRPGATVDFDGIPAVVVSITPLHIIATTPTHAAGAVNVTVTNVDAQLSTLVNGYEYILSLVALGTNLLAVSESGITWAAGTIPAGAYMAAAWNGALYSAVGGAVAADTTGATSSSGDNWIANTGPTGIYRGLLWTGTKFIAVGQTTGVGNYAASSVDGKVWANIPAFVGGNRSIATNGPVIVTVGEDAFVANGIASSSADGGLNWTARTIPNLPWKGVAWNAGIGAFVAVGATFPGNGITTIAARSVDGATWVQTAIPNGAYLSVASNGTIFVAVGTNAVAYSMDGTTWLASTIPAGAYTAVIFAGDRFVAIGSSVAVVSLDGINWEKSTIPAGTYAGLAWNGVQLTGTVTPIPNSLANPGFESVLSASDWVPLNAGTTRVGTDAGVVPFAGSFQLKQATAPTQATGASQTITGAQYLASLGHWDGWIWSVPAIAGPADPDRELFLTVIARDAGAVQLGRVDIAISGGGAYNPTHDLTQSTSIAANAWTHKTIDIRTTLDAAIGVGNLPNVATVQVFIRSFANGAPRDFVSYWDQNFF